MSPESSSKRKVYIKDSGGSKVVDRKKNLSPQPTRRPLHQILEQGAKKFLAFITHLLVDSAKNVMKGMIKEKVPRDITSPKPTFSIPRTSTDATSAMPMFKTPRAIWNLAIGI